MAVKKDFSRIALFETNKIRKLIFNHEWWFSVVDIISVLTNSQNPSVYWRVLKKRLIDEGSNETVTKCNSFKMISTDGKMRLTDCANTKTLLRLVQSIPSSKVEPLKLWLAKVGQERIEEIEDPELAMDRAKFIYEKKGYSKDWIDKRIRGIAVRQNLTEEWQNRGAKIGLEYAILTNEIMSGTFNLKVEEYKKIKNLSEENLRDHMTDIELILTMLAEATTTKLHQDRNSAGFGNLIKDAKDGGSIAGRTRKDIEKTSGNKVISSKNYLK